MASHWLVLSQLQHGPGPCPGDWPAFKLYGPGQLDGYPESDWTGTAPSACDRPATGSVPVTSDGASRPAAISPGQASLDRLHSIAPGQASHRVDGKPGRPTQLRNLGPRTSIASRTPVSAWTDPP
eukprot:gene1471-32855_t